MYCSNCASQIKPELNYCNNCGQKIAGKFESNYDPVAKSLSSGLVYIGIFALLGFVFLIKSLLENGISDGRLVGLAAIYLASIFGIVYLILQRIGPRQTTSEPQMTQQSTETPVFKTVDTNQLEAPKEAPSSVVENTTRTLDKVPVNRD